MFLWWFLHQLRINAIRNRTTTLNLIQSTSTCYRDKILSSQSPSSLREVVHTSVTPRTMEETVKTFTPQLQSKITTPAAQDVKGTKLVNQEKKNQEKLRGSISRPWIREKRKCFTSNWSTGTKNLVRLWQKKTLTFRCKQGQNSLSRGAKNEGMLIRQRRHCGSMRGQRDAKFRQRA